MQGENCNKLKLTYRLTMSLNTVFVPNQLPDLFARWLKMTHPLLTKIGPITVGSDMQSILGDS